MRLSLISDRQKHPAQGLAGGKPGAPVAIHFANGSKPHPKSRTIIKPGERLIMRHAGGGGYGDPKKRDRESVRRDVRNGYVTKAAAIRDYGVDV
jgi:N-methylhydantoinase B